MYSMEWNHDGHKVMIVHSFMWQVADELVKELSESERKSRGTNDVVIKLKWLYILALLLCSHNECNPHLLT